MLMTNYNVSQRLNTMRYRDYGEYQVHVSRFTGSSAVGVDKMFQFFLHSFSDLAIIHCSYSHGQQHLKFNVTGNDKLLTIQEGFST